MGWNIVSETTEQIVDKNPDIYVKRAENALIENRTEDAVEEMDNAIQYCVSDKKSHYYYEKAKILYGGKRTHDCIRIIEHCLKDFYNDFDLRKFKEVLTFLSKVGNYSQDILKNVLRNKGIPWILAEELNESDNSYSYFELKAKKNKDAEKYETAQQYCDLSIKIYSSNFNVYFIKGYCYQMLGKYKEAIIYYDKSLALYSKNDAAYNNKALIFSYMGNSLKALENYEEAIRICPRETLYINNKGEEYIKIKEYENALINLLASKKIDKNNAKTLYLLGEGYDGTGQYLRALHYYKKAKSLDNSYNIPNNKDRDSNIKVFKWKVAMIAFLITIGLVAQFQLFSNGTIKPMLTNIQVRKSQEYLEVGKIMRLTEKHSIFPFYGIDTTLTFKSLNEEIATVKPDGTVTGIKEGQARVAVMSQNKKVDEIVIDVIIPKVVSLNANCSTFLKYTETDYIKVKASMNYSGLQLPDIEFSSTNPKVIAVNKDGKVTALGVGNATVIVRVGEMEKLLNITSINSNFYNGQGSYAWANGDKYEGEWQEYERDGQGTMIWANGDKYVGEWMFNRRQGKGTMTWANGDKYEGNWFNNKMQGKGVFTRADGTAYEGEWDAGTYISGKIQ